MFSEIIQSAQFDILFFSLMFFVIMIGYALAATILFGVENRDFQTFNSSLMTNVQLMIGAYQINKIKQYHESIVILYIVSLYLINLILLNMFVAIIGSHYSEYYADNSGSAKGNIFKL